ncbi:EAL domain-containing protein [Ovoidimarina sediminis]|uniref:EAL domain-containing protein n=1 Tax=Ovoidimarina sediminis TaxID=3079856 RepID=UPI00290CC98B|nr:EAL domain-containing protein [Rhodophyticola sp. MJ-SS7]MDU8946055.1 EAL domain-containing protein [Rhodophyticola sp. MJ-SS7]
MIQLDLFSDPALRSALPSPFDGAAADARAMVERAVEAGDVHLAYQPVVASGAPGAPAFFEGLVRIRDGAGASMPAGAFIEAIEPWEIGRTVDCLALRAGLAALRTDPGLTLSINLSARSFAYPRWGQTLIEGLKGVADVKGRLILEITESSAMGMPGAVARAMQGLRARGVRFAMDDFGAGCTSFRYLKAFRFEILKIDGQFIGGIHADGANRAMTRAFTDVARHFGMATVAEKVEDARDAAYLAGAGIDYLQGYLYGRPAPRLN